MTNWMGMLCLLLVSCHSGGDPTDGSGARDATFDRRADAGSQGEDGQPLVDARGATRVEILEEPGSRWQLGRGSGSVQAAARGSELVLEIDYTSEKSDGRYAGIYVRLAGQPRLTGSYAGSTCSMFIPDRPYLDQEEVRVRSSGEVLDVEMREGRLSEVAEGSWPDASGPILWKSKWQLEVRALHVEARGLYYLMLPKDRCTLDFYDGSSTLLGSLAVAGETAPFTQYYDRVRRISVASSRLGGFDITTDVERLQVELPDKRATTLFELDFDHSFKERGQESVTSSLTLSL